MLEPIFYCRLEKNEEGKIAISKTPLPPGAIFVVTGYAKAGVYTLVSWAIESGGEAITGENLWLERSPLATDGGSLSLFTEESSRRGLDKKVVATSTWDLIPESYDNYKIPQAIARQLRSPTNYMRLN